MRGRQGFTEMSFIAKWSIRLSAAMASGFLSAAAIDLIMTSSPYNGTAFVGSWVLGFAAFVIFFAAFIYTDLD